MRKFLVALVLSLLATGSVFAKDIFVGVDPTTSGAQQVFFTSALADGDRVVMSFATNANIEQPVTRGNVSFANQGQFSTPDNNDQNEICLTFKGEAATPKLTCGMLSGTVQFSTVGLKPNKVYQAYFVTKGPAPAGIRVKYTPAGAPRTGR